MKIIPASFEILDDLDRQSLAVRIEVCGRICYKSEDKITPESARPFISGIIKHGHNSVTEMAALTLKMTGAGDEQVAALMATQPKYLIIDRLSGGELLISGTIRAFREMYQFHSGIELVKAVTGFLAKNHSLFFEDMVGDGGVFTALGVILKKVPLAEVDKLPAELLARHRHVAVKFIVNRAVTHEIVRHRPCSYLQESQRYCRYSQDKFDNQVTFIRPMFFAEESAEYRLWQDAMVETEKIYLKLLETSSPQAARTVLPNSCKTELITFANLIEWRHIFRLRTSPAAEPSMREVMIPLLECFKERFPAVFVGVEVEN